MAEHIQPGRARAAAPFVLCGLLVAGCFGPVLGPPAPEPVPDARGDAEVLPSRGRGGTVGTFPAETILVRGRPRQYRLVVPSSVDPARPTPLVFAFHGIFEGKDFMPLYSHLDGLACGKGFVLVYPEGEGRCWPLFLDLANEDLAFFDALYSRLTSRYNIDLNRVYLVGMSNGAYFSHLVASQRSDRVAAVAAHSGGLTCTWPGMPASSEINAKRKYPVLLVHGDADTVVYAEESRKARDAYEKWGHEVEYDEIANQPHHWAHEHGVNERIWKFFVDHPRR
jgi:polyhydroxybutyrate depolymerase